MANMPVMPDPRLPLTDASGVMRPEWVRYFQAVAALLKQLAAEG